MVVGGDHALRGVAAVTVGIDGDFDQVLGAMAMIVATPSLVVVLPVAGSVTRTASPALTSSIGLREPLAITTNVPGTKLFLHLMNVFALLTRSPSKPLSRLTSAAAFSHFHGAPYLAANLPSEPPMAGCGA
ncbi:hypothetical protein ACFFKH_12750 [Micromonospora marina]|nr:hypothetical protein [Micromonospora marina]